MTFETDSEGSVELEGLTTRYSKRSRSPGPEHPAKSAEPNADAQAKNAVAVALSYAPTDQDGAPKVVATGRGWFAEKILEIAFANDVKVREDPDLAEMLAAVDLDSEIPVEAFIAVAEILRYVYAANGTTPTEAPQL